MNNEFSLAFYIIYGIMVLVFFLSYLVWKKKSQRDLLLTIGLFLGVASEFTLHPQNVFPLWYMLHAAMAGGMFILLVLMVKWFIETCRDLKGRDTFWDSSREEK